MTEILTTVVAVTLIVLGIIIAFKFKGFFHKVISIGLAVLFGLVIFNILLAWIVSNQYIITSISTGSFILFSLLSIVTFIYGLIVKDVSKFEKISILIMGVFVTVNIIFRWLHLPGAYIMKVYLIIPIIITLASFLKVRKLTKEMSFMIFWLFHAIGELITFWIK